MMYLPNYHVSHDPDTLLHTFLRGKITSVFPSTTAAGVTTFLTGLALQQHAVTGWFMYLKEVDSIITSLLFQPRCCQASLRRDGLRPDIVYGPGNLLQQIDRRAYSIHHKRIANTDYNSHMNHTQKVSYLASTRQINGSMIE